MNRRVRAALLAMVMLFSLVPATIAYAAQTRMTRCNLRLRAKTSTESDTLIVVPGGTEVAVEGTSGGWTKTTYLGHTGYISTDFLMDQLDSGYYPLREGDESPLVKELQLRLIALDYMTGSADGKYTATTTAAVKAFQAANGIGQDGLAGGETQRVLYGDSAKGMSTSAQTTGGEAQAGDSAQAADTADVTPSGTVLRKGSKGEDVKKLQARLIELGYLTGKADGVFGGNTESAVIDFQKRSSLSTDGRAGSVTQSLLYSSSAVKADGTVSGATAAGDDTGEDSAAAGADASYQTLKRGMTSNDVKQLQAKLKELGYFSSSATGYYGSVTQAAVKAFQQANSLDADGIAGRATQVALFGTDAKQADSGTDTTDTGKTYQTLKQGMKSSAVTTMQKKLKELGYFNASTTGLYGSITKEAVIAFQKNNGLKADGVAGGATLSKLYDGAPTAAGSSGSGATTGGSKVSGPNGSSVKLLHWFDSVKPSLKSGSNLLVYDPASGYGWTLRALSLGRHLDAEPLTAEDTASLNAAFGNKTTWTPKTVYVKLPSGTWTMATTHNTPHLSGGVKNNNFDGHLCVHFLRDMDEASKNDPNYGVQNQKVLREAWKRLSGETVK